MPGNVKWRKIRRRTCQEQKGPELLCENHAFGWQERVFKALSFLGVLGIPNPTDDENMAVFCRAVLTPLVRLGWRSRELLPQLPVSLDDRGEVPPH